MIFVQMNCTNTESIIQISIKRRCKMAIVKCPECKKKVSSQANSCPHCGYSIKDHVDSNKPLEAPTKISQFPSIMAQKMNPLYKALSGNFFGRILIFLIIVALGIPMLFVIFGIVFGIPLFLIYRVFLINGKLGMVLLVLYLNIMITWFTWRDKKSCMGYFVHATIIITSIIFCLDLYLSDRWDFF